VGPTALDSVIAISDRQARQQRGACLRSETGHNGTKPIPLKNR
jgi:hypothetical protein